METLRLLVNGYKHTPSQVPEKELLERLGLDTTRNYATMPESGAFRKGLAQSLNLKGSVDYCDIADEFLKRADRFLAEVQRRQPHIAQVRGGRGGARPSSWLI